MSVEIKLTGGAGEYMESATVVAWNVAVGDRVQPGDVVAVVETAKAATEIEATTEGILVEISAPVGAEVQIGSVLGRISTHENIPGALLSAPCLPNREAPAPSSAALGRRAPRIAISPLARQMVREANVDVETLRGTGPNGRIKARDVERALSTTARTSLSTPSSRSAPGDLREQIVLIHGFGANAGTWRAVRAGLEGTFTTMAVDLPGHGTREPTNQPRFEGLVEAISADLKQMGSTRLHLVGHSLGAAVAAAIASQGRVEVSSLTMIAPAGLGPEIDARFIEGFLSARSPESLTPWLERLVVDTSILPEGYAAGVLRERSQKNLGHFQAELARHLFPDGTQIIRIPESIGCLPIPVRIVWGRADRIIPFRDARDLGGMVALHLIPDVGHMPHVEVPALIARIIAETVRSAAMAQVP